MNILNICVNAPFNVGFSYQENLLPKYQKLNGHNVSILAPEYEYASDGNLQKNTENVFVDNDGIVVKRLAIRGNGDINSKFKRFIGFYKELEQSNPDIIFCHLFQFIDFYNVIKYVKSHPNVKLFVDSHADFNNSASNYLSKKILHGIIWKYLAHKALPYTERFYGVTPARVDFLLNVYGLPKEKVELLPLCADDLLVKKASKPEIRESYREELGISDEQFLIVSGGKIDHNKPQTLNLMKAVNAIKDANVRLAVFGSVGENLKKDFQSELSKYVVYVGWKNVEEIYKLFSASDLVAFPGLHSVLWEQAVGMGKACVFKRIPGFDHIDLDGNCMFFEDDTIDCYIKTINDAIKALPQMTDVAQKRGIKTFSYKRIAKESIAMRK